MNTSNILLRRALARKTAALKTIALEAVALDAARCRAEDSQRRAEKKIKKAMWLVKKVVKMLKAERKAKRAEEELENPDSPISEEEELELALQQYKAFGEEYRKRKEELDTNLLEGNLSHYEHRWEVGLARLIMADNRQHCGWVGWDEYVDRDFSTQRKAECMAWHDKSANLFEERYWKLLILAADCILDGTSCITINALLEAALQCMEDWGDSLGRDDGQNRL
ncbi:hypothetical protein QM012_002561 [Aureobasidium pullulans]|uniref:Uncharacterized protein n=1 Tax=Aureobasidium pullulans TaxID=5580 RepID=A0ABR0T9X3_AURPU